MDTPPTKRSIKKGGAAEGTEEAARPTGKLLRRRPRSYAEWSALARWGKLPPWEPPRPGFLLRQAREQAGLSQVRMAERLGVTQQAVARAEGADSNPSFRLLEAWASALGGQLEWRIVAREP